MSGPWKKVSEPVAVRNLSEIMSEEVAKSLQLKEDKLVMKFTESVSDQHLSPADEDISLDHKESEDSNVIKYIAKGFQCQLDKDDVEIKVKENKRNDDAKISITFDNYCHNPSNLVYDSDSEDDLDDVHFTNIMMKDWDTFETHEKEFVCVPKKGYKVGEMVTKHDKNNRRRNACPVMAFPPDFCTGDVAGFDLKLPDPPYTLPRSYKRLVWRACSRKYKESQATPYLGIEKNYTKLILFKLNCNSNGMLDKIKGVISTGKESVVLHANSNPSFRDMILPKECAIKVFTTINDFKTREMYKEADCYFKDYFSKQNSRKIAHMWAEKEMNNMMRLKKIGINCPDMICFKNHVLVMSFIGRGNKPAPKIKDIILKTDEWASMYEEVVDIMHKMFNAGHMVHGDLSEYNILWHDKKCWIIDVPQSVDTDHPHGLQFLQMDCRKISDFFSKKGVPNLKSAEDLFQYVTGFEEHWRVFLDETKGFFSSPCSCKTIANFNEIDMGNSRVSDKNDRYLSQDIYYNFACGAYL